MESKWYTEGRHAYSDDLSRDDCPYSDGTDGAREWKNGFDYAAANDPLADHNL